MPFNHPDYAGVRAAVKRDMHPAPAQHPDTVAVNRFAEEMATKMAQARAKGRDGWETCPPDVLSRMLREHVEKGDPRDVANFCMMLWHLGQPIAAAPAAQAVEPEFFTVFASHNGGKIALPGYSSETEKGVKDLVLQDARQEGYKGTVSGRLLEMGWWIGPVFANPYEAASPAPDTQAVEQGIEQVAKFLQKRADAYADEHLSTDPDTGATEGGAHQIEYWNWLLELVDEVRTLRAAPAPAAVAVPWENFPAFLIDHCEGDIISEEGLQSALAAMLADPQYAALAATPPAQAQCLTCGDHGAVGNILTAEPCPDCTPLAEGAPPHQGMTIAGGGASELGKLMRTQWEARGGLYPDGNPNAGQP